MQPQLSKRKWLLRIPYLKSLEHHFEVTKKYSSKKGGRSVYIVSSHLSSKTRDSRFKGYDSKSGKTFSMLTQVHYRVFKNSVTCFLSILALKIISSDLPPFEFSRQNWQKSFNIVMILNIWIFAPKLVCFIFFCA